jgi:hypothetical protein
MIMSAKMITSAIFIFQAMMIASAQASSVDPTQITRVLVGPNYGTKVILTISNKPAQVPACQTNPGYNYVFDASSEVGKITLSVVLTAYASGKSVWLGGSDQCDIYAGVETLKHIVVQ